MGIILSIDTSQTRSDVAIARDGQIIYSTSEDSRSDRAAFVIKKALSENNITIDEIETILIGIGPGSFTGVRTGISFASGLIANTKVSCLGVSVLLSSTFVNRKQSGLYAAVLPASPKDSFGALVEVSPGSLPGSKAICRIHSGVLLFPNDSLESSIKDSIENYGLSQLEYVDVVEVEQVLKTQNNSESAISLFSSAEVEMSEKIIENRQNLDEGSLWQVGLDGLSALYVKPVNAKTLHERRGKLGKNLDLAEHFGVVSPR